MSEPQAAGVSGTLKKVVDLLGPLLGLAIIIALFSILAPQSFLTGRNMGNVAGQILVVALTAVGMTYVIVSGGIDLSVGSLIALSGVTGTMAINGIMEHYAQTMSPEELETGWPVISAICGGVAVSVLTGAICGALNGIMITKLRLPPFIVTLGTLEIFRGTALQITGGLQVTNLPDQFEYLANAELKIPGLGLVVPYSFLFLIVFAALAWLVLRKTVFGTSVYAIGSNEQTAGLCGIRVNRSKVAVYALCGLATGIAGIIQSSRLVTGQPTIAVGRELDVIAAVVIGGGSLLGGEGTILGSMIGAAIMGFLRNGCNLVGISPYVQRIVIGSIIILAVFADLWRHRSLSSDKKS